MLGVALMVALFAMAALTGETAERLQHVQGTRAVSAQRNIDPAQPPLKFLFIGNSYTFFYDLPGMIVRLAESGPGKTPGLRIDAITFGGATLEQHWKSGQASAMIRTENWTAIVLQEQSLWAMDPQKRRQTAHYAQMFAAEARKAGAKTLIVRTWPRKPGSDWYRNPQYRHLGNATHMNDTFTLWTEKVAAAAKAGVIPVSDFWMYTSENAPDLELYDPDGSHPSAQGSFLTALTLYRYLTGKSPLETAYKPREITKAQADRMRRIAALGKENGG